MLNWIGENLPLVLCFVFGILFLIFEAIIPGFGVSGIVGSILSFVAIILTWNSFGPFAALGLTLLILSIIAIVLSISIKSIKSGKLSKSPLVLKSSYGKAYMANQDNTSLFGKKGIAISDLHPAGIAEIDGKRIDVVTEGEYIKKGETIKVTSLEDFRIIVKVEEK